MAIKTRVFTQLFITYSRLKRKDDADRELARFKTLEEARKQGGDAGMAEKDELPPPKVNASVPDVKQDRP